MIKPPFTVQTGLSGTWIIDGDGVTVCEMALLLDPLEAFRVAELFAVGANERIRNLEHLKQMAKKAGRPRSKKPSQFALAKRKERAKTRLKSTQ